MENDTNNFNLSLLWQKTKDEAASIAAAFQKIRKNITPEMERQAIDRRADKREPQKINHTLAYGIR